MESKEFLCNNNTIIKKEKSFMYKDVHYSVI